MKRSKLIALTLSGVLALSSAAILAGCGGNSKAGADTTFTWYLTAGEDGYYSDYEDNPVIEYIMENMQFEGSDGEMKYIAFDFFQPTTTENARSEFNQKYMSGNWEDVIDPTMSRGITDMYEAGVVADLTPYITDRELMPTSTPISTPIPNTALSCRRRRRTAQSISPFPPSKTPSATNRSPSASTIAATFSSDTACSPMNFTIP